METWEPNKSRSVLLAPNCTFVFSTERSLITVLTWVLLFDSTPYQIIDSGPVALASAIPPPDSPVTHGAHGQFGLYVYCVHQRITDLLNNSLLTLEACVSTSSKPGGASGARLCWRCHGDSVGCVGSLLKGTDALPCRPHIPGTPGPKGISLRFPTSFFFSSKKEKKKNFSSVRAKLSAVPGEAVSHLLSVSWGFSWGACFWSVLLTLLLHTDAIPDQCWGEGSGYSELQAGVSDVSGSQLKGRM